MKAISEYFRDLAERDRFFGAEPPQPDAEYLHRIAEQTVKSRVNAEVSDNSLILRQEAEQSNTAPSVAPAVAAAPAPAAVPEPAPAPVAQPETAAFVEPVVIDRSSFGEGDTIAEKLQRIRAVVSRETAEPAEDTSFYNEDEHADDFTTTQAVEPPASFTADDSYEDETDSDVLGSVMADVAAKAEPEAVEEAPAEETPADDVVAEAAAEVEVETEVEAVAEEAPAEAEVEIEETAKAEEAPVEEEATKAEADEAEPEAEEVTAEAEAAPEEDTAAVADILAPVAKPRRRIIVQKISRAEVEAAHTGGEVEATQEASAELDDEAEAALMRELAEVEADMDTGETEAPAEEDTAEAEMEARALASAQAAQDQADAEADARKKAEAEAAEAEAAAAKVEADAKEAEEAEALAKVMAEAAEVEAEANTDNNDVAEEAAEEAVETAEAETSESDAEDAADENRAARIARRSLMVEDEDAALNRLMDATSTRLSDDDEGAVRRASIAHLKAAVAATKADDSIAKAAADEEERELDQYRDDLARVVRPGRARPRAEGASTSRPAPLVLVSEQRIDAPAPQADAAAAMDIRPRRITSGNLALKEDLDEEVDENLFSDANVESFSDYAARHDALELPDLLEAAAAHYAFVEGTAEFTRPMLMRKIASLTTGEAPSREAGLRSFGSLLRESKIVKGEDGKFVLSGKSRFTPEAREAGE